MYRQGDELKLCSRPEWGTGKVTKVEHLTRDGERDQRLWVKFPNVGMKTILAGAAQIERVGEPRSDEDDHSFAAREMSHQGGWLGEIMKDRPEEAMTSLPQECSDPFTSVRKRLERTLTLFRFEASSSSLIDWAIAQTGLDDPLSRFNRHELEAFFEQWRRARDAQARELTDEARRNRENVNDLIQKAPPGAKAALQGSRSRS
jgi:hypothetical protein